MAFTRSRCTRRLLDQLALPETACVGHLETGRELIHDLAEKSALVPHDFHHSTYPDRSFSFFIDGQFFAVWEVAQSSTGPDRVEVWIDPAVTNDEEHRVARLLAEAMAVHHNAPGYSSPIIVKQKQPLPARPPTELIDRLNKFCDDAGVAIAFPEMEAMAVQMVLRTVLRPTEAAILRTHLESSGWSALSPRARSLVERVLAVDGSDPGR